MGHVKDAVDATERWGADVAKRMGVTLGRSMRDSGATLDDESTGPLSGEWADGLTPMTLAYEVLGQDYDLDQVLENGQARWEILDMLCDSYEEGFYLAVEGVAVPCGPLTAMNAICESPGTYCDHDMTRTTEED